MKLELKHLSPYLPYGLKIYKSAVNELNEFNLPYVLNHCKPILHPLSDLTKKIKVNGKKFVPIEILDRETYINYEVSTKGKLIEKQDNGSVILEEIDVYPYWIIQKLYEWHFDVFGLIEKGLAISIHNVEQVVA